MKHLGLVLETSPLQFLFVSLRNNPAQDQALYLELVRELELNVA